MNRVNSYILHLCLKVLSDEILLHISLFFTYCNKSVWVEIKSH